MIEWGVIVVFGFGGKLRGTFLFAVGRMNDAERLQRETAPLWMTTSFHCCSFSTSSIHSTHESINYHSLEIFLVSKLCKGGLGTSYRIRVHTPICYWIAINQKYFSSLSEKRPMQPSLWPNEISEDPADVSVCNSIHQYTILVIKWLLIGSIFLRKLNENITMSDLSSNIDNFEGC